jgi:hypothetical protein
MGGSRVRSCKISGYTKIKEEVNYNSEIQLKKKCYFPMAVETD